MRCYTLAVLSIFLVAALMGCGGGGGSSDPPDGTGPVEWTVMVYINADNNLEAASFQNITQMQSVGSSNRMKIVVQWDRIDKESSADGNWTSTRRYEIRRGSRYLVEDMGELDMGDPGVLGDFVTWAQQAYPANHYCLVIWNHGSGWRSRVPEPAIPTRGISYDDTSSTNLSIPALADTLRSLDTPIDVVAMDACVMQMLEVAYELKDAAGFLVASQDNQDGRGYAYDRWLAMLRSNPAMDAPALSKVMVDTYINELAGSAALTHSVVDLSKIAAVGTALDSFTDALSPYIASYAVDLAYARDHCQQFSDDTYKDLLDYALRVRSSLNKPTVSAAYTTLEQSLDDAIVYERHDGGTVAGSHGLSVWAPDPAMYRALAAYYGQLQLARDISWDEFLSLQRQ